MLTSAEENFGFENDTSLKEAILEINIYTKKLFKTMSKIRKLKLTFTVEDQRLITLIDEQPEDFKPSLKMINSLYEEIKLFISNLSYEFEELQSVNYDDSSDQLNQKIIHYSGEYINFLRPNDESILERFFVQTYLYRNEQFNNVLNFTSEILNLMLHKLALYNAAIYLRFFEENLLPKIENDTKDLEDRVDNILGMAGPIEEFEDIGMAILQVDVAITFTKASLASRKPDNRYYANTSLDVRMLPALGKLRQLEIRIDAVRKEMGWVGEFINFLPNYNHSSDELKSVGKKLRSTKIKLKDLDHVQQILNGFNFEREKAESYIEESSISNTNFARKLQTKIENDVEEYLKQKDALKFIEL